MFGEQEHKRAFDILRQANLDGRLSLGVKKLLMISEMARQDVDKLEKFTSTVIDECSAVRPL